MRSPGKKRRAAQVGLSAVGRGEGGLFENNRALTAGGQVRTGTKKGKKGSGKEREIHL